MRNGRHTFTWGDVAHAKAELETMLKPPDDYPADATEPYYPDGPDTVMFSWGYGELWADGEVVARGDVVFNANELTPPTRSDCYITIEADRIGNYTLTPTFGWECEDGDDSIYVQEYSDHEGIASTFGWRPLRLGKPRRVDRQGRVWRLGRDRGSIGSSPTGYLDSVAVWSDGVPDPGYFPVWGPDCD